MKIDPLSSIKSQLAIITGMLVLAWIFDCAVLIPIATGLAVLFLILPSFGNIVAKGWLRLALFLGHWNGRILLTLLFFLFLTPIALVYRIFNKSDNSNNQSSNWVERKHKYTAADLEKTW